MASDILERKMQMASRIGIMVGTKYLIWPGGFIGRYQHVMGVRIREEFAQDETFLAIAEELFAMQATSRLLEGKFFYASINFVGNQQFAEIFYDNQFAGEEHRREILPKFLAILKRITDWLNEEPHA